jgi:hypothetical protein
MIVLILVDRKAKLVTGVVVEPAITTHSRPPRLKARRWVHMLVEEAPNEGGDGVDVVASGFAGALR